MYKALFLFIGLIGVHLVWSQSGSFVWNKKTMSPSATVSSPVAPKVVWEPYIDWGQIFPSFLLSIATTDPNKYAPEKDYLGDPKGVVGLFIKSSLPNTRVKVTLDATRYSSAQNQEFVLPNADQQYVIFPHIAWNYDLLRQNKQSLPIIFTYTLFINGVAQNKKHYTTTIRGVGDCPIAAVDYRGRTTDLRGMFAAYVNEDHPKINELLGQALQKKTVNSFNGYQGSRENVVAQVFAIWCLLRDKGMKYSDIATTSRDEQNQVVSQRVRTFQEAISTAQANCVDGTLAFASILRAIGISPQIILIPGHAMLGFYADGTKKDIVALETTLIGESSVGKGSIKHEFAPIILAIGNKTQSQTSAHLFLEAINAGFVRYHQAREKNPDNVLILDVSDLRSLYKPIGL